MLIHEIVIENFRGYEGRHRIGAEQLTALVGRNDSGKSTILDSLGVFFEHPLCKVDFEDVNKAVLPKGEMRIGLVFRDFPRELILDSTNKTSLHDEHLLNADGFLEIHKVWSFTDSKLTAKPSIRICAVHPRAENVRDLLQLKITDLRKRLPADAVANKASCASLRSAIWSAVDDLDLGEVEVPVDKEDAKEIWSKISDVLPHFALFRADRASTDEDAEVQDPLKIAVSNAIASVQQELDVIIKKVSEEALEVATRTLGKLSAFDPELASELTPKLKALPKWESIFKLSLTGDSEISINRRGSGVRRLVLFSFFQAEVERLLQSSSKTNVIYAVEEPETAQHPDNQVKVMQAFVQLTEASDCQVFITTHTPAIARLLPEKSIRFITKDDSGKRVVIADEESVLSRVAASLGVLPNVAARDSLRTLVCVEGPHDIEFLTGIERMLEKHGLVKGHLNAAKEVVCLPLGGSTLQDHVNKRYLRLLGVPEIHIYDRDQLPPARAKYQDAADQVNGRGDNSIAFITSKREMENYLDRESIVAAVPSAASLAEISDWVDVENEIFSVSGQRKFERRSIKSWLNAEAVSEMTLDRLAARQGLEEILSWFEAVEKRVSNGDPNLN